MHNFFALFLIFLFPNILHSLSSAKGYILNDAPLLFDAKCIDGTPPIYYYLKGDSNGFEKWYIHFESGGWCTSEENCYERSLVSLGTSANQPEMIDLNWDYFQDDEKLNPLMHNWNKVYIHYCDGGSFSGNAELTYKPNNSSNETKLYFKGKKILNAVFEDLKANRGLNEATDVVISGGSAGGLATFLHLDHIRQILNPNSKVVGLPDSGYFIDFEGSPQYHSKMIWNFNIMNSKDGVNANCIQHYKDNPSKCIFAENVLPFIQTPIFVLQSKFDGWQKENVYGGGDIEGFNIFGDNLLIKLKKSIQKKKNAGVFIDSCLHHCGLWNQIEILNATQAEAFFLWYNNLGNRIFIQDEKYICEFCCNAKLKLLNIALG